MPRLEPVTSAMRPVRSNSLLISDSFAAGKTTIEV
jgi:hypothetical protein